MSVLASRTNKGNSEAYIFKEAALQTTERINLKLDLVTVNQGRVHEDEGNLLQVKRGYLLPIVLGSRGAILKATTEGTSSPHNHRPKHNYHYFLNCPKKLHPTIP
jgi:hypothetical protein